MIERVGPGGVIELASGEYDVAGTVFLSSGGSPGQPVTIRGPLDGSTPRLRGNRANPYNPNGEPGRPLFRLDSGADHLSFANLHCEQIGNGCFLVAAPVVDLSIAWITATNVRRFFENAAADGGADATISRLRIANVTVSGFSKGAIRLAYNTHDVTIADVSGDSLHLDGDNFAIGVHLLDTVHDVTIERVTMNNARDTLHDYWNGDGFAAEEGVRDLTLLNTSASGNTDAGYDLKASDVRMINAEAAGNKRNFRLWGSGIVLEGCTGVDPHLEGGTGTQAQVHVVEQATVSLVGCRFIDSDADTIVFQVEDEARVTVHATQVERSVLGVLSMIEPTAVIEFSEFIELTN